MNAPGHKLNSPGRPSEKWRAEASGAFTLVEIMVTVALLSVIILGLVAMFNQTRRAFTSSLTQVDVLESGRAVGDLLARDLEQLAPTYYSNAPNFYVVTPPTYGGLINQLANPTDTWTNLIQELFFLTPDTQNNQQWIGTGYRLLTTDVPNSVGALYRYNITGLSITNSANSPTNIANFNGIIPGFEGSTNLNRIIDGVTYFRILAYQTNGVLFPVNRNSVTAKVHQGNLYPNWEYFYYFSSNAVPAYVEVEMGILEARTLEHYRSLVPGSIAANNYLGRHPEAVHIFRQRIPIRNVDPAAFQ